MTAQASLFEKLGSLPTKFFGRLRTQGLGHSLGWCLYQFQWRIREWKLGIRTKEFSHGVVVNDQGEQHGYEPIDYLSFDQVLDYLSPITKQDGFLDYGCGMGRAVILAATKPFGTVLGVELDERLVAVAQNQIQRVRSRGLIRADRVEILQEDATQFEVPADINHIFLFNSFTGLVLQKTLEQINRSLERFPRPLKLIYIQPVVDENPLANIPWLKHVSDLPTGYWTHIRSLVYVSMPLHAETTE